MADTPAPQPTKTITKHYHTGEDGLRRMTMTNQVTGESRVWVMRRERHEPAQVATELPRWVKLALADKVIFAWTIEQAAKKYGKSMSSLSKYHSSPAGRKWMEDIRKCGDDPQQVATALLQASVIGVTKNYLWALDTAKDSEDYREVAAMSRDILDRFGMRKDRKLEEKGGSVVINLGGISLEAPRVEVDFREIMPAEIVADDE